MPSKPRKKPAKKASKTTKKRGVVKPTTSRRTSPELNKARLREDIAYYEDNAYDYNRRTKPTARHKQGLKLSSLEYDVNTNTYYSQDGDIRITEAEYKRIAVNPNAVPKYIPIKRDNKIKGYYRQDTGQVVTPYYRDKIFGKRFRTIEGDSEEERDRATAYVESNRLNKISRTAHRYGLVDSYLLVHPEFVVKTSKGEIDRRKTRVAVLNDDNFIRLVEQLQTYNYNLYGINLQNVEALDEIINGSMNLSRSEGELKALREALGRDPEYQNILVELGRRKPSDVWPVGDSPPGYIKNEMRGYYESKNNSVEFSEE